jgi:LAO/AO transport system kinase
VGRSATIDALVEGVQAGDRRLLARAITLVESTRPDHRRDAEAVLDALLPRTGGALRLGITGSPGVGKSTFIEALGLHVAGSAAPQTAAGSAAREAPGAGTAAGRADTSIAVLAVDPSSSRTGGSILGDKTRMTDLSRHPDVFIRPSPGGTQVGGVARRTREAMLLCEAAGYEVVLIETIGVGQSEVAVADLADVFCLLVGPGGGDDLQGVKRGIMELADLVVVNKADGDLAAAAERTRADYANALHLLRPKWSAWSPPVLACSALTGLGVDEVWTTITSCRDALAGSGELPAARTAQAVAWMWSEVEDTLLTELRSDPAVMALVADLERGVAAGEITPAGAAKQLLEAFRKK